jgi:hypothetical protein
MKKYVGENDYLSALTQRQEKKPFGLEREVIHLRRLLQETNARWYNVTLNLFFNLWGRTFFFIQILYLYTL